MTAAHSNGNEAIARVQGTKCRNALPGSSSILAVLLFVLPQPALSQVNCTYNADLLSHPSQPDTTLTYIVGDGSGQIVEPDILYVPSGWHGYKYWMAMTPFPYANETAENPSILASNNGRHWDQIPGAPNPIYGNTCSTRDTVNNDPCILMVNNTLYIYFLRTHYNTNPFTHDDEYTDLFRVYSADGVHWFPQDAQGNVTPDGPLLRWGNFLMSPSVLFEDGTWYLWLAGGGPCNSAGQNVWLHTSTDGRNWPDANVQATSGLASACRLAPLVLAPAARTPFHLTVKHFGEKYEALISSIAYGACDPKYLFYGESTDRIHWTVDYDTPLLSATGSGWDAWTIYRSSFLGRYPNMAVWYGAAGTPSGTNTCNGEENEASWRMGFTKIGDYLPPKPVADLNAQATGNTVALGWTAPGDDEGVGTASAYDLRLSTAALTAANFNAATAISVGSPQGPGASEAASVSGLSTCTTYYFALKSRDEVGNWSDLSDVAAATTGCPGGGGGGGGGGTGCPDPEQGCGIDYAVFDPVGRDQSLRITLKNYAFVQVTIHDAAGRAVAHVFEGSMPEGTHTLNLRTRHLQPGIYFVGISVAQRRVPSRTIIVR